MSTDNTLPEAVRAQIERKFHFHFEGYRRLVTEIAQEAYRLGSAAAAQQERARLTLICHCGYAMLAMSTAEHVYGCTKCGNSVRLLASHPPPTPEEVKP